MGTIVDTFKFRDGCTFDTMAARPLII